MRPQSLVLFSCGFLLASVFTENTISAEVPTGSPTASNKVSSAKEWRKPAADRQRRIIFNNDGAEPVVKMTRPSAQDFLDLRTSDLVETQVDSIFYCPRCSGFGLFTYFTRVGQVFTSTEGRYANNQMAALQREGIDPLQLIVDFCRKNGKEVFCSFRMNDNHDGTGADYAPLIFRANKLKNEHPEYLLGRIDKRPKIGAWASVDYGHPEVRDLAFRFAEEVCQNYDLDGIELDFFRHPVFFKSNSNGQPATDEDRAAMTELLVRIRAMADAEGKKRGKPFLIAVRTPDSVDYARAIGLDIEKWMTDDLMDLYIPSGSFQLNDWEYSVALGHKHGVKVYPSLDESRVSEPAAKARRMTELAYRGRAADVWAAGADGVYLYNFFDYLKSDSELLNEMGDAKKLATLDQNYFGSVRGVKNSSAGNLPFQPFLNIETLTPETPKTIAPGETVMAKLKLPTDFSAKAGDKLALRMVFSPLPKSLKVLVNGSAVESFPKPDGWLEYKVPTGALRGGDNEIQATISAEEAEATKWKELFLEVRTAK